MKFLLDLGAGTNEDLAVVEMEESNAEMLEANCIVLASGTDLKAPGARDITAQELAEHLKPKDPGEEPTEELATKKFNQWQEWKKVFEETQDAVSDEGWNDAENAEKYLEYLKEVFTQRTATMEKWKKDFGTFIAEIK